jgi:hypothetical protein
VATACVHTENQRNTGSLVRWKRAFQPDAREGQAGLYEVADRPVVVPKLGNASGAKGPEFKANVRSGESQESGDEPSTSGNG